MTPTQREGHERHKAFRAHIARVAVPDCVAEKAVCKVAPVKTLQPESFPAEPDPPLAVWVERQKQIWFSIVDEIDPPSGVRPTIGLIQRICAAHYDLSVTELLANCRQATPVRARQVAIFLCKELTLRSMPEIGRKFGDRDHTTVLHSIRKIERLESSDSDLADGLVTLRERIRGAC